MSEEKKDELLEQQETEDERQNEQAEETKEDVVEIPEEEILKGEGKTPKTLKQKIFSGVAELLLYVVIALVCIFIIPQYVVQRTEVSGPSMEATLQNEDNILVEKLSYRISNPKRFDIIVFYHFFEKNTEKKALKQMDKSVFEKFADKFNGQGNFKFDEEDYDFYVKRIIGLPGETVQIVGETIYINGKPLEENYGKDPITYQGVATEPITLGDDEYFVLGDNREVSQDSRYKEVGNIKKECIVGKAWVRVYPFNKMGILKH